MDIFSTVFLTYDSGSLVTETNLMSRQVGYFNEMRAEMSEDAKDFYGDYFERYVNYLSPLSSVKKPHQIKHAKLHKTIEGALLDKYPSAVYK